MKTFKTILGTFKDYDVSYHIVEETGSLALKIPNKMFVGGDLSDSFKRFLENFGIILEKYTITLENYSLVLFENIEISFLISNGELIKLYVDFISKTVKIPETLLIDTPNYTENFFAIYGVSLEGL
jgi:hypothetical protein